MPEIAAVGAIAVRDGALLLIRRGHAPSRGRWSLPGGRVEPGETAREALVREMAEETGLVVEVGDLVGEVTRPGPNGVMYRIQDFRVTLASDNALAGGAVAGDDAADVEWVPLADLAKRPLSAGLLRTLRQWAVL
ncbi:MAG TPA: NUDIX domain-containing protein [Acidothermaceae bacterium]|nr:NUDIX domain-containing protein [Acidothermaceae bacterium]